MTNDGELANRLTHPRYELSKTYEVMLKERIGGEAIEKLKKGTWLSEGKTGKSAVKVIKRSQKDSTIDAPYTPARPNSGKAAATA